MESARQIEKCDGQIKGCFTVENNIENYMKLGISMMLLYSGQKEKPRKMADLMFGKSGIIESKISVNDIRKYGRKDFLIYRMLFLKI